MMGKPRALLMLSGGLDSVWALWRHLDAGEPIRTHHVRLLNWERRAPYEGRAVADVLAWANRSGLARLIEHSESTTDFGGLRYIPRDHHTWGYWAGVILSNPANEHITKVVRTFHKDSVIGGLGSQHGQLAEQAWREPIQRMTRPVRDIEFVYPMLHMSKAEIVTDLPADLRRMAWYCRRPKGGRVCHECHTCKQVDAADRGEPWIPLSERG